MTPEKLRREIHFVTDELTKAHALLAACGWARESMAFIAESVAEVLEEIANKVENGDPLPKFSEGAAP